MRAVALAAPVAIALVIPRASSADITVKVNILSKFHPRELHLVCESGQWEMEGEGTGTRALHVRVSNNELEYALQEQRFSRSPHSEIRLRSGDGTSLFRIQIGRRSPPATRRYRGELILKVHNGALQVINEVSLRDYLQSVVAAEAGEFRQREMMKVQALASRTFVMKNLGRHREEGYDFCDLTHCQVYKGAGIETLRSINAVVETADQILTFRGQPIDVMYHSTCGGSTTNFRDVWGGCGKPYLKGVEDRKGSQVLCGRSPHYRWKTLLRDAELQRALGGRDGEFGQAVQLEVVERDASGRVKLLRIGGEESRLISGAEFHSAVGRTLGWNRIKSTWFRFQRDGKGYVFEGQGLGHGVGICQWGASRMAALGYKAEQIIQHYLPGVSITNLTDARVEEALRSED